MRVYSDDVTVYVTVSANSTNEEPTTTIEEIPTPTTLVEDTEEYKRFENALPQTTDDDCTYHAYIVGLNLFHANKIGNTDCENRYSDSLKDLRELNPCKNEARNSDDIQFSYAIQVLDANIRLLCSQYEAGNHTDYIDEITMQPKKNLKLCPILNLAKTDYTKFQEELIQGCSNKNLTDEDPESVCINGILKNYREMQVARSKLKQEYKEKITHIGKHNETITLRLNVTDSLFDLLSDKCPQFDKIESISGAISNTISLATILIYSIFIIYINMYCFIY
jgi:hypothetical protein